MYLNSQLPGRFRMPHLAMSYLTGTIYSHKKRGGGIIQKQPDWLKSALSLYENFLMS